VVRTGALKVLEARRVFFCGNSKCNTPISIEVKVSQDTPSVPCGPCPHCKKSSAFTENTDLKVCHDYQEVRVQVSWIYVGACVLYRCILMV
jgi:DNA replicative helicase MCM subunit Mcm2 (Cdc46/Mcm family)